MLLPCLSPLHAVLVVAELHAASEAAVILLSDRLCIIITVSDDSFYVFVLILHKCVFLPVQEKFSS